MIVYIYNIGVDLYNGFNGLRHRINWTYFTVLDGLAHPLYSVINMEKIKFEEIELTEAEIKELENLQKNMARGGSSGSAAICICIH